MSIHSSGDGFATHDSSLVYEARCAECQFDQETTIKRMLPESRNAAVMAAVHEYEPVLAMPRWLTLVSIVGGSAAVAALVMGAPIGALVVRIGALVASLAPIRWVLERLARRRQ